jgi:hypothetical protein
MRGGIEKKPKHGSAGIHADGAPAYILKAMKTIHKQNTTRLIIPSGPVKELVTEDMHSIHDMLAHISSIGPTILL